MTGTALVLMAAHCLEVFVWSYTCEPAGAAPANADIVYFAFVSDTTLGYGDIVPVAHWYLLGPMTAMNGVPLFGRSTAVLNAVLRRTLSQNVRAAGRDPVPPAPGRAICAGMRTGLICIKPLGPIPQSGRRRLRAAT